MRRIRWRALAVATAGLVCVSTAIGGAALAAPMAGGVKGSPQPEAKPFKITSAGYGGAASVAIEPSGSFVVAYGVTAGEGKIVVCLLNRGAKKCAHTVTLSPLSGDDMFDAPQVFIPSANHVVVLMNTCCDTATDGDNLVFSSTNGGKTFAAPVRVGSGVGISVAAMVGRQIIFSSGDDRDGAQVESIPVDPSGPPAEIATANAKVAYDIGVGDDKGGALVGSDYDGTTSYTTYVEYAAKGDNFNASASYHRVGSFPHEELVAMSGTALLTQQTAGKEYLKLRLFNGTKFGAAHIVPGSGGGGPGWFALSQDPSGRVHVFTDRAFAPVGYDLYERSTATGATWNAVSLGNGIDSDYFGIALDANSTGLVVGSDGGQATEGYPVLGPQGASLSLKESAIKKGHTTTASGKGSPVAKGRSVALQVERSGLWSTIASTHESASGGYSFTVKGTAAGAFGYRAVVADDPGYREYGYSAARTLKVS